MKLIFWQSSRFWVRGEGGKGGGGKGGEGREGGDAAWAFHHQASAAPSLPGSTSSTWLQDVGGSENGEDGEVGEDVIIKTHINLNWNKRLSMNSTPTATSKHFRTESFRHCWCSYKKANHKSNRNLFLNLEREFYSTYSCWAWLWKMSAIDLE